MIQVDERDSTVVSTSPNLSPFFVLTASFTPTHLSGSRATSDTSNIGIKEDTK
jgi:hypothetical protein